MESNSILSQLKIVLETNPNKAYTLSEVSKIIKTDKSPNEIKKTLKLLINNFPNNCHIEKIDNVFHIFYADAIKLDYIHEIKTKIIYNMYLITIRKKYKNENIDIFHEIDKDTLDKTVDVEKIIEPFIKKIYEDDSEEKLKEDFNFSDIFSTVLENENLFDNDIFINETLKDLPNGLNHLINKSGTKLDENTKKWFDKKRKEMIDKKNDLKSKSITSMCLVITPIILITSLISNYHISILLTYVIGLGYFLISKDQISIFKKMFLFYLLYNFISSVDIIKSFLTILPYDTIDPFPEIRIFTTTFLLLNALLYLSYNIAEILVILQLFFLKLSYIILGNLKIFNKTRVKINLKIYKMIKKIEHLEDMWVYSIVEFVNKFLNMDIKFESLNLNNQNKISYVKLGISVFMLQMLIYSTSDFPYIGKKQDIINSYVTKNNGFCKNIDNNIEIIKLKNGNVLVKEDGSNTKYTLDKCNLSFNIR